MPDDRRGAATGRRGIEGGRFTSDSGTSRKQGDSQDLPDLATLVEQRVDQWRVEGNVAKFRTTFYALAKLSGQPRADLDLGRRTMQRLAEAYLPLAPQLRDAYSCVAALYACAKVRYWEGGLPRAVLERLEDVQLLREANGQDHANLWWAVSEAPPAVAELGRKVLDISAARLRGMSAEGLRTQECSNVLLACSRLQYGQDPAFLHHITACLVSRQDIKHQELSNSLYSLGKLAEDCSHQPQPGDLRLLTTKVTERLQRSRVDTEHPRDNRYVFIPQGLSNMLLGCAKLGLSDPELLQLLADAAGRAGAIMKHQELANSMYALGKFGCSDELYVLAVQRLVAALRNRLRDRPDGFVPCELSNVLLSLEALQKPRGWEGLAVAVADECRRRGFAAFGPQALNNSVWALAKLGWVGDQAWYSAAVEAAVQPGAMAGAKPQSWSNLLYGLALVRHRPHERLMHVIASEADGVGMLSTIRSQAKSQECANLLWALAVLDLHSEQRLVDTLADRLGDLLRHDRAQVSEQALVTSLWALAVMGPQVLFRNSALVEALLREAVGRWEQAEEQPGRQRAFAVLDLVQLGQVQQELGHAAGSGGLVGLLRLGQGLLGGQPSLADAAWSTAREERIHVDPSTSQLQEQVVRALRRLARNPPRTRQALQTGAGGFDGVVSVVPECEVPALCCRVDVLVEMGGGRRVAVEVDGPSHFLANDPHMRTKDGPTLLRDRQLERVFGAGNVVTISYWDWDALGAEEAGQEQYLRRLLGLPAEVKRQGRSWSAASGICQR